MKKLRPLLFLFGRLLSIIFVAYYVVAFLITLLSGVRYQFSHNPTWVALPFIVGSIGLVVGYSVYFVMGVRKSYKEHKTVLDAERQKSEVFNEEVEELNHDVSLHEQEAKDPQSLED